MAAVIVVSRVALLATVLLIGVCGAVMAHGGGGFSAELIHRDSLRSPFYDPSLTAHDLMLAAARRSTARAAAIALGGDVTSQVVSRSSEYLMTINVGTPPVQSLAILDTGSDLVWINCRSSTNSTSGGVVLDPSASTSYAPSFCDSTACQSLAGAATSCGTNNTCQYKYSYQDGSQTSGVLSTETFTFDDGVTPGSQVRVRASFGCSTANTGATLTGVDGLVGLGGGADSLATQLSGDTSLNMKFSYCLVPRSLNLASFFNFGARANVTEPGAATTPMIAGKVDAFYTVALDVVKVAGQVVVTSLQPTPIVVDSGTTLTYLDTALLDPLVAELAKRVTLPRAPAQGNIFTMCYEVSGVGWEANIPDVTLELGGGAALTLRPENTFVPTAEGTACLALVPVSAQEPMSILGNIAQQNFHIGYDLAEKTITFAPANCGSPSTAAPASYS